MIVITVAANKLADLIRKRAGASQRPFLVALDGRSGTGKSTFAASLAQQLGAAVVEGDDFFAGGVDLRRDIPASRAAACIDWRRQRNVIETLAAGRGVVYRTFDWNAFDGTLADVATRLEPKPVLIIEGVYAARPELADLLDLRVLLLASDKTRLTRLQMRGETIGAWDRQWHEAEDWYFSQVAPVGWFDVIVDNDQSPPGMTVTS